MFTSSDSSKVTLLGMVENKIFNLKKNYLYSNFSFYGAVFLFFRSYKIILEWQQI